MFELCLISSKSKADALEQYDKVFEVPQRLEKLKVCNAKEISPLRNRVILESLSSLPEVQSFVKEVEDFVSSRLCEVEETGGRLSVCICCSTGTHMSVCCVERLYQIYTLEQHTANLTVQRHHKHATVWAKDLKKRHNLVWQQTRVAGKYFRSVDELQKDRMWCVVPLEIEPLIEEEFQKDPFNSACVIGSYQVNFELGELYSKRDLKTYRLRCVEGSLESRVECRMVDGPSYKKAAKHFGAAGVLCYSAHPTTGQVVFLLGHINYSTRTWCDFGGLKSFREKPRQTAARECFEETLGVLGEVKELYEQLGNYKDNHVFKIVNESSNYVSHFLHVTYNDYPDKFKKELLTNDCTLEVDDLKWFSLASIRDVMKKFLMGSDKLWAYPILPNGSVDKEIYYSMREEFVQTMCMAEKLGILHSIEHITGRVYQRKQPVKASNHQPQATNSATELVGEPKDKLEDAAGLQKCEAKLEDAGAQKCEDTSLDSQLSNEEELEKFDLASTSSVSRELQDSDATTRQAGCDSRTKTTSGSHCNQKKCEYRSYGIGVGKILPMAATDATAQSKPFYSKFLHHP